MPEKICHRVGRLLQLSLGRVQPVLCHAQDFQGQDLGLLQRPAEVAVGVEDLLLAVDLIAGRACHVHVDVLDFIEAVGDVAPRHLHPNVVDPLPEVDFGVGDLVHHRFGVVADRVEGLSDLPIAFADLHGLGLLAHHLVEHARLAQGPGDHRDPALVEIGNALQEAEDGRVLGLGRHDAKVPQGHGRLVEVLHGTLHDDV